jgi:hypothetical protein
VYSSVITKPNFSTLTAKTPLLWTLSTLVPTKRWLRLSKIDKSGLKKRSLASKSNLRFLRRN